MIVLSGASSVGKTTLLEDWCRKHTEYRQVKEIARGIMKDRSITRRDLEHYLKNDLQEFWNFQHAIFEEQNHQEYDMIQHNCSFIADRGPDPLVFAEQNIDHASAVKLADSHAAKKCLDRYRSENCVVVVVSPLDKVEDDNVRIVPTPEEQIKYTECLQRFLHDLKIPYEYCNKTDRLERIQWLERILVDKFQK